MINWWHLIGLRLRICKLILIWLSVYVLLNFMHIDALCLQIQPRQNGMREIQLKKINFQHLKIANHN